MILLKKILVATHFSDPSDAALAYGRELARTFNASLTLLHVAENLAARGYGADGFVFFEPEMQRELETSARKQLEGLLCDEDRGVLQAKTALRTSNAAAATIVEFAREAQIDLIVMGTHGRGAVAHLLMGSVAERVVRTAPCPVLTVRHPEHEFVVPDALRAIARACAMRTIPAPPPATDDLDTPRLVLRDGTVASVRTAGAADRDEVRLFFHDLSAASRWKRFFTLGEPSQRIIDRSADW